MCEGAGCLCRVSLERLGLGEIAQNVAFESPGTDGPQDGESLLTGFDRALGVAEISVGVSQDGQGVSFATTVPDRARDAESLL